MTTKNLFALLSCAAIFIFTFSASFAVAQIFDKEEPTALSDSFFPAGITGAWRLNTAESDDVLTKISELLKHRNDAPTKEPDHAKLAEQPPVSISLFAPDALILSNGDSGEMTINEIFRSVIETRTVIVDGTLREYEIYLGAKVSITASGKIDGLTVETVSPRGNKMTETFRLASGGAKLIVVVRVERLRTGEVLNLRRVYNREPADTSFVAE